MTKIEISFKEDWVWRLLNGPTFLTTFWKEVRLRVEAIKPRSLLVTTVAADLSDFRGSFLSSSLSSRWKISFRNWKNSLESVGEWPRFLISSRMYLLDTASMMILMKIWMGKVWLYLINVQSRWKSKQKGVTCQPCPTFKLPRTWRSVLFPAHPARGHCCPNTRS